MEWLVKQGSPHLNPVELERLGSTYDLCREQVDRLIRYASKDDRLLLDSVVDMVTGIRTMDRAARTRGENYDMQSAILIAYTKLINAYQAISGDLANATGELRRPYWNEVFAV